MQITIAVVTAAIALIVAVISWQQWVVNRERFRLELYDRRFAVYVAVLEYFLTLHTDVKPSELGTIKSEFLKRFRETLFLFPEESGLLPLLNDFQRRANEILVYVDQNQKGMLTSVDVTHKFQLSNKYTDNNNWMIDFMPRFEAMIAPYLRFSGYKKRR